MITQKDLNGFFAPLNAKIRELVHPFCKGNFGFDYEIIAYSKNYSKLKTGKYYLNSYPLPAILIHNYCIVIVSNDDIIITSKMKADDVYKFDLGKLQNYDFEIYNPYDRNDVIWKKGMTKETLKRKMIIYEDNDVTFEFHFDFESDNSIIYNFVKTLKRNGFYLNN